MIFPTSPIRSERRECDVRSHRLASVALGVLEGVGIAAVIAGVALVSVPAALVILGVALVLAAAVYERRLAKPE